MAVLCPYCEANLPAPEEDEAVACPTCGQMIDLQSQRAFLRAEEAFLSVADDAARLAWHRDGRSVFRAKAPPDSLPLPRDVIHAYQRAYTGLRVALDGTLPRDQRFAASKMLADVTRLFAPRAMVSPLEAEYWAKRTVAAVARQELDAIRESLAEKPSPPVFGHLKHLHLRLRRRQLRHALSRLEAKLAELEHAIGFL